jgi:ABC-type multidrug transport system fused ATPase/permease subunit
MLLVINFSNFATALIEAELIPKLNGYLTNFIFSNLLKKYENSVTEIELGKITTRLSVIPNHLRDFVSDFCVWIFPRILTILIINIYFFILDWRLGIISILSLFIYHIINYYLFKKCIPGSEQRNILLEERNQDTQDKLVNSFSIYSTGNIKKEIHKYERKTTHFVNVFKQNLFCLNKANIYTTILIIFIYMYINSFSTYLFLKKEISFKVLMSIINKFIPSSDNISDLLIISHKYIWFFFLLLSLKFV